MANSLQVDVSYKQVLKIALPISLALLVPQFNFIINNIFLGHLSEQALATASITGVYYLIFTGIGWGLNNGLQALVSRRAGENRPEEIGRLFDQGILISMLIAVAGISITYFIAPFILKATIREPVIYEKAISFLRIRIWGLPFLFIYQMRNALLVGINQSRYLVIGTLAEAVSNIFFDYTFIFGKWGFPQIGFNGAAYSSIISEFLGMFVIFIIISSKGITKQFSLFKDWKWSSHNASLITKMSGPLVFQSAISIIAWAFFYILVEHHGQQSLAVSNTMRNIFGFFGVFVWAFASTSNSMVSNVIGQGRNKEVFNVIKKIVHLSLGFTFLIFLALNIFPNAWLSIYGQSGEFIAAGIPVLRVVASALLIMSVSTIWLNAVTGTGNTRVTFIIEVFAIVFYCVYVYLVLEVYQLSIVWGWMSEFLYWIVLFTLSYWYLKKGKWAEKKLH